MSLRAIIFDHDGTLAQTTQRQEAWLKFWWNENRSSEPWPFVDFDEFTKFYNEHIGGENGVQEVYDQLELPCDMGDMTHPVWHAYEKFKSEFPAVKLYEGIKETLQEIWELSLLPDDSARNVKVRIGINSTNTWRSIRKDLVNNDALHYFDCHVTAETLNAYQGGGSAKSIYKPSPISVALMLNLLGVRDGSEVLHIGDSRTDLGASHNIIVRPAERPQSVITVGACYGYEGRTLLEQGYEVNGQRYHFDHLIDKPRQLVGIVKNLL
jgi:phosphoglycolate phosphatase-like HAD superfamily hydrolase